MLNQNVVDYVQHLERGYCANHPDVIAGTKTQVVDRAVKQLLGYLQSMKCEISEDTDGIMFALGHNATSAPTDPLGKIRLHKAQNKLQYYSNAGQTWKDLDAGVESHIADTTIHFTQEEIETPGGYDLTWIDKHLDNERNIHIYGNIEYLYGIPSHQVFPSVPNGQTYLCGMGATTITLCLPNGDDDFQRNRRLTVYAEQASGETVVTINAQTDGKIILPGAAASGVNAIKNTPAAVGDCITLAYLGGLNSNAWVVVSKIGTWVEAV